MSGSRANVRQRARYQIVKKAKKATDDVAFIEVKSGDGDSSAPVVIAELSNEWTQVPLIDRVISVRRVSR